MSYIDDLKSTRDNIATKLKAISASPKPNYTIEGQTVAWADYFKMLSEQLKATNELISSCEPFELHTQGYS